MRPHTLCCLLLSTIFAVHPFTSLAFETDQFNLPPVPLADIGNEVSQYVEENLRLAVDKVNSDISKGQKCIGAPKAEGCGSADAEIKKLKYLRSNNAIARELFKRIGDGSLMFTKFGKWMNSHKFNAQPASYKTSYRESIFIFMPYDYLTISPTVRLFGSEFGIDKLEHFFQQGYKYYTVETEAISKGLSSDEAARKAVKWGQRTERTYYGLLVSGVYSNADLYANYAGMKFYAGLTATMQIGNVERAPIVVLIDGKWVVDGASLNERLLKPFLTDHMNEALNPSSYAFNLFPSVRRAVKKYGCPEWRQAYPDLTLSAISERSKALELWNGEDYGFTKRSRMVTIAETCFETEQSAITGQG